METLIFEDEHIQVYYWPQPGTDNTIIITFCELGMPLGQGAWGKVPLSKSGIPYIGFVSKRPNWFPTGSVANALKTFADITERYNNVITYGHSQGGYAALKYGRILEANRIISFCPQFSIDPLIMEDQDPRFEKFHSNELDHKPISSEDVPSGTQAYVFFDPLDKLDKLNVELIREAVPHLKTYKVFGTGHQTIRAVASSFGLNGIITGAIVNDELKIRKTITQCKREWFSRTAFLARSLSSRHPKTAAKLVDSSPGPISSEVLSELISNLYHSGEHDCLNRNIQKLSQNANNSSKYLLLQSLLGADRCDLIMKYGPLWLSTGNAFDPRISKKIHSAHAYTAKLLSPPADGSMSVIHCEGWHDPENWGAWGCAIRSRIMIHIPGSANKQPEIQIPVTPTLCKSQTVLVKYYKNGRWIDAEVANGFWILEHENQNIIVDFTINQLKSPSNLGNYNDRRFLGVRLPHIREWKTPK